MPGNNAWFGYNKIKSKTPLTKAWFRVCYINETDQLAMGSFLRVGQTILSHVYYLITHAN